MQAFGVICEFNPFHNGHGYLLSRMREAVGEDGCVICLMSGRFVQRGEPAIADPYLRACMALAGGADLVLELPFPYAAGSAEFFASAGVGILTRMGVERIAFGSESGDISLLIAAAEALNSPAFKSTYADGLLKVADANGRVHTTFKQTGTATGRLSSTEPNLQNIPVRTELGRELRRFFKTENSNYVIIDADYSQIELRLLAHVSSDANMIAAFKGGADIHTSTAATVFGVPTAAVTPEMRKKAKAVNFGIMYGIGAFSLSDDIGVSRAEAQDFIDRYLASYPGIDAYLKNTIKQAYEDGFVTTEFGRRRQIPELLGTNKMQQKFGERVAMNSPIQGTAADVIKLAMIRVHKRLRESGIDARLILQVHDELLIESHRSCAEEAKAILKEEMEHAVEYSVPLDVDIHIGNTWFEAK